MGGDKEKKPRSCVTTCCCFLGWGIMGFGLGWATRKDLERRHGWEWYGNTVNGVKLDRNESILREIEQGFTSLSIRRDLAFKDSPQYKAAWWMIEEDRHYRTANLTYPLSDYADQFEFRQRFALATLYYATNGPEWYDQCNFMNATAHVCEWNCPWPVDNNTELAAWFPTAPVSFPVMGAVCGLLDGLGVQTSSSVVSFEMSFNNLNGTIPEEIQGLDGLTTLQLSNNGLYGSVPIEAFTLGLFGTVAESDPFLAYMHLNNNNLQGTISPTVKNFSNIQVFNLNENTLTGTIPEDFGLNKDKLTFINLESNKLEGTIPESMFAMPNLGFLNLQKNRLNGTLPEIQESKLETLYLNNNDLTGTVPSSISNLKSLSVLYLNANGISGKILQESYLYELKNLTQLNLGENRFVGSISSAIGTLQNLNALYISPAVDFKGGLSGTLPTEIGNLQNMENFLVSWNDLRGTIPTEFGKMSANLKTLALDHNNFGGTVPTEFNQLVNLVALSVEGNPRMSGTLEGFCNANKQATDVSADCKFNTVECPCCTECCNPNNFRCSQM